MGKSSEFADATVAGIRAVGGTATANYDSVADPDGCRSAVQTAVDEFGKLDIVVGCAGAIIDGTLTADDDTYQQFINLFLSQKFWLARAALPAMAERGWGRFITTTSHGATGALGQPIFAAAMGGVISMTKAIATEYADSGITANCLSPGGMTRLHTIARPVFEHLRAIGEYTDEQWESYLNTPPPEYVAPIVAWLCSDAADGVTGQVFHASAARSVSGTVPRRPHDVPRRPPGHAAVDPRRARRPPAQVAPRATLTATTCRGQANPRTPADVRPWRGVVRAVARCARAGGTPR